MSETFRYVPVLKWKQGEYLGLSGTSEDVKQQLIPLIEIIEPDTKPWDEHLKTVIENIARAWGSDRPFYLDMLYVGDTVIEDVDLTVADKAYQIAVSEGLSFVPVVGPSYTDEEIRLAANHVQHGVCIRLTEDVMDDDFVRSVQGLLRQLAVQPSRVDLIYDMGFISMTVGQAERLAVPTLNTLASIGEWRSLTICGTSFPQSMQGYPTGQVSTVERKEWQLWNRLTSRSDLNRKPSFGDYAIQHPELVDFDPVKMHPGATIRYALDTEWLLVRGYGLRARKRGGFKQFKELSNQLRQMDEFYGEGHCQGCQLIDEIADREKGYGNLSTWRQIGTCHHITVTAQAIEGLSDALGTDAHVP